MQHIEDCLLLLNANSGLQEKIKNNEVSATTVAKRMKQNQSSDEIENQITQAQKNTGRKKITEKNLPAIAPTAKVKQSNLLKEVSKADEFRKWLKSNMYGIGELDYAATMNEFNRIYGK